MGSPFADVTLLMVPETTVRYTWLMTMTTTFATVLTPTCTLRN